MKFIILAIWKIVFEFKDYRPKKVNFYTVFKWLCQFPIQIRLSLFMLLGHILFYSEKKTGKIVSSLNKDILDKLKNDNVNLSHIIYISHDSGAGSSQVILNMLKDSDNLERKGARLISDSRRLEEETSKLGRGAIIYVDDFIGTGDQFIGNRNWLAQYITGAFAEFIIAPVICEESIPKLNELGIVHFCEKVYALKDRPLHQDSCLIKTKMKNKIVKFCESIDTRYGLGYKNSAAMVVFYRNSVKNIPLLFRGNLKQTPLCGIFPRNDDLPY